MTKIEDRIKLVVEENNISSTPMRLDYHRIAYGIIFAIVMITFIFLLACKPFFYAHLSARIIIVCIWGFSLIRFCILIYRDSTNFVLLYEDWGILVILDKMIFEIPFSQPAKIRVKSTPWGHIRHYGTVHIYLNDLSTKELILELKNLKEARRVSTAWFRWAGKQKPDDLNKGELDA